MVSGTLNPSGGDVVTSVQTYIRPRLVHSLLAFETNQTTIALSTAKEAVNPALPASEQR